MVPETRHETLEKLADGEDGVEHFQLNFVERFFIPAGRASLSDQSLHLEKVRWWSWKWWSERRRQKQEERVRTRNRSLDSARLEARRYINFERPLHD